MASNQMRSKCERDTPHKAIARAVVKRGLTEGVTLGLFDGEAVVRLTFDELRRLVVAGRRLSLPDFGVFSVRHRKARRVVDFSGAERLLPASKTIHFRPAAGLRRLLGAT